MLPLIKQSFDFPKRKIELTHGPSVQASWVDGLKRLIRNRNPEWSRLVRGMLSCSAISSSCLGALNRLGAGHELMICFWYTDTSYTDSVY
jgi:hypothetical protein